MKIEIVKETKTLQTEVFEAMGETSMCWEPIPKGVFQSTNAERIGKALMLKIESDLPNAVTTLIKALSEDKTEGSYYYSWQANIAMAFKDEWDSEQFQQSQQDSEAVHRLANQAAKNFLNLLCHKLDTQDRDKNI